MPPRAKTPGPIPKEALAYFNAKGLAPAFSYLDVWKEEHTVSFTVAKVLERDLLADVQESLSEALEEGVPFKQWAKQVKETLDQSGWTAYVKPEDRPRRLYTIYGTNQRVARAVGQWDRIERTKRTQPYLEYALGPSERHRPEHVDWSGTILPVDDPWWDDHMPPNGWGCKCHVIPLSRRVSERRGGVTDAPDPGTYDWKNPKTGETETIPVGIDPGWDYNPGKSTVARRKRDAES